MKYPTLGRRMRYVPQRHPQIVIALHVCGGNPYIKGTRLPAAMVSAYFVERLESGDGDPHDAVRRTWGEHVTDEMIDAAVWWRDDPEHERIHRLAIRRQRYAEAPGLGEPEAL